MHSGSLGARVFPSYLRPKAGLHPVHRGAITSKQTTIHTCDHGTDSELTANRAVQQSPCSRGSGGDTKKGSGLEMAVVIFLENY